MVFQSLPDESGRFSRHRASTYAGVLEYFGESTGVLPRKYWHRHRVCVFTLAAYSLPNKKVSMASFSVDFGKAPCPI